MKIIEGMKRLGIDARKEIKRDAENMLNRVIFARPLKGLNRKFDPPTRTKSEVLLPDEEEFLESVIRDHADFVLSNLNADEVKTLVNAMEKHSAKQGETVITQGDTGDYLYIVKEGTVRFLVDGEDQGSAGRGTVVGELALLYDCPRAATVLAETDCEFYRVSQETFRRIQASFILSNDEETRRLLKGTNLFQDLPDHLIRELASCMFQKEFKKGDILLEKGDMLDEIYFVQSGHILGKDISIGNTKYADLRASPGDNFGSVALVSNTPMYGTAECLTDGMVYILTKERFFRCLKGMDLHEMVQKELDSKIIRALPLIVHSDIDSIEVGEMVKRLHHFTLEPGDTLATIGDQVEPALYFLTARNKDDGHLEVTGRDGVVRELGPGEKLAFGRETLILSNVDDCKVAALHGKEHELINLSTEAEIQTAKQNMLEYNTVTSQRTVIARGSETLHLRKLTMKDLKDVIYDPLRLGKDYRKNRLYDKHVTKETLQKKQLLGQGTFGQVWLCREPKRGLPYALKIQYKRELIQQHQAEGVIRETRIMEKMNHPFVMGLVNSQQDSDCLYLMMKLVQGGELRQQMRNEHRPYLAEKDAKFYAACMLEGLSYMHRRSFVYRDLKGENVLLDKDGYCVIVDLGFAKYVPDKTFTFCGTPIFIAPEVVMNKGHDKSADIWSLGVMIYEMLFGTNPFFDYDDPNINQHTLFRRIAKGKFQRPVNQASVDAYSRTSQEAKDLIKKILVIDVRKRLGCMANADLDIRNHPWFAKEGVGIDFGQLYRKEIVAPWVPELSDPFDGTNFEAKEEDDKRGLVPLTSKEQKLFQNFG
mmetsp:Transcript_963/g.2059  ORF Transcript_963/g.2059 Transcript_963/m.2059 type:complete len:820 (+) Transcript_963:432-2891(+)